MKINCDKCGYILGGIEVKENYGCNTCNPFWKNLKSMNGGNPVCPDCLTYDRCEKHLSHKTCLRCSYPNDINYNHSCELNSKLNPPILGNTHSAVNSEPVLDCFDTSKIKTVDYLDEKRCKHNITISKLLGCSTCFQEGLHIPKAPTRPPLPIKYCGICARILTQTSIGTYYDHDTAEQYNHWRFTCPEYRWWKIWDRYHTNFRCNEDGGTYAYEA